MTPRKVIERLCAVSPPIIASVSRSHGRCVLATRVGIGALAQFGIAAVPLAVDVDAFNPVAAAWFLAGQPDTAEELLQRGGYYLSTQRCRRTLVAHLPSSRQNVGRAWDGHLVIHVPARACLVDLDMRQLARPEFNLLVPAAEPIPWNGLGAEAVTDAGARLVYVPRRDPLTGMPDLEWQDSRDWNADVDDVIAAIVRAIRKAGKN